jgi:hypothetical protein
MFGTSNCERVHGIPRPQSQFALLNAVFFKKAKFASSQRTRKKVPQEEYRVSSK